MYKGSVFGSRRAKATPPPAAVEKPCFGGSRLLRNWRGRNLEVALTGDLERLQQAIQRHTCLNANPTAQSLLAKATTELAKRLNS